SMLSLSQSGNALKESLVEIIESSFEDYTDWSKLYPLSWTYALCRSLYLREKVLYTNLKRIVLDLIENRRSYNIAIYDHEGVVGILFSLYHIADKEKRTNIDYNVILEDVKRLHWHEFDGEVMMFSYMLATKINAGSYISELEENINNYLDKWFRKFDYEAQRNIVYTLFGLAYLPDKNLVSLVSKYKLYLSSSSLFKSIINSYDVELIALTLYIFGRLAYYRKLRKELKNRVSRRAVETIRYKLIPELGNILNKRILELNLLSDPKSIPPDLIAKIELARVESGLDKPFILSKHEWWIYQQVLKMISRGYFKAHRYHLISTLLIDFFSPIAIILFHNKYPQYFHIILPIVLNIIYGVNASLVRHGVIKKESLLGVLRDVASAVSKIHKRGC
ncbi:hypothetical protein DRO21_07045, partial [archaeon]